MSLGHVSYSEISSLLRSSKVKDRSQGLQYLESYFSSRVEEQLEASGREWRGIFEDIFTSVRYEQDASRKKASKDAAEKRLRVAAGHVRRFFEKTLKYWRRGKDLAAALNKLLEALKKHVLYPVLVADYLRAVRAILNHPSHYQHIDHASERDLLDTAFSIILGNSSANLEVDSDMDELDSDVSAGSKRMSRPPSERTEKRYRSPPRATLSAEQQEAFSVVSLLLKSSHDFLLPAYTIDSDTQEASDEDVDWDYPTVVLQHIDLCLELLPPDHTIYNAFLPSISHTLSHLALNRTTDTVKFAFDAWGNLLEIWGAKNKFLKEALVDVLQRLLPYRIFHPKLPFPLPKKNWIEGIYDLWRKLERTRWGSDQLSFNSIRLELVSLSQDEQNRKNGLAPYVHSTFQAGSNMSAEEALAWAVLKLKADCGAILYKYAASYEDTQDAQSQIKFGRHRLSEHPILSLLRAVEKQIELQTRVSHLQTLLFFIDGYWASIADTTRQRIKETLISLLNNDQADLLVWSFMCLGAIIYCECREMCSSNKRQPRSQEHDSVQMSSWDSVWAHAIRRANVPVVCRAASHVAHGLLFYNRHSSSSGLASSPVTHSKVLTEVESFLRNVDVQGPPYPSDAVCNFLSRCIQVASQDSRLYRFHLEEKVLVWLLQSWRAVESGSFPIVAVNDIIHLFQIICGFGERADFITSIRLPTCLIVQSTKEVSRTQVIQDFLLDAELCSAIVDHSVADIWGDGEVEGVPVSADTIPHRNLGPRERNICAFFRRRLEDCLDGWTEARGVSGARVERVRTAMDLAVLALLFEGLTKVNGARAASEESSRAGALQVVSTVVRAVTKGAWNAEESALILAPVAPLIRLNTPEPSDYLPTVLADAGTGIRADILAAMKIKQRIPNSSVPDIRRKRLLRAIWGDCSDSISDILSSLNTLLSVFLTGTFVSGAGDSHRGGFSSAQFQKADLDDHFAISYSNGNPDADVRSIIDIVVATLVGVPLLQSHSGEQYHSEELMLQFRHAIATPSRFLTVFPSLVVHLGQKVFSLSSDDFEGLVQVFANWMRKNYETSADDKCSLAIIQFLAATLPHYVGNPVWSDPLRVLHEYIRWQDFRTWEVRVEIISLLIQHARLYPDFARFLDDGRNTLDPKRSPALFPGALLPRRHLDADIRVRFQAARDTARLYAVARSANHSEAHLYTNARRWLAVDSSLYEYMLTRVLHLGNTMITSSSVRRGPYWHLLELCLQPGHTFSRHVTTMLHCVSESMGFDKLSLLFETYASQTAFSLIKARLSYFDLPFEIAGYDSQDGYVRAAFRSFAPMYILEENEMERSTFNRHCEMLGISQEQGMQEIFGEVVANELLEAMQSRRSNEDVLETLMFKGCFQDIDELNTFLQRRCDSVVVALLRSLGTADASESGSLQVALRELIPSAIPTMEKLSQHVRWKSADLQEPLPPAYSPDLVIRTLEWFLQRNPGIDRTVMSYHVLQELFAAVHASPLVAEQLRLLASVLLWVTLDQEAVCSKPLLHALMHGAALLLSQPDLACYAQSILDWSISQYSSNTHIDYRFQDVLLLIAAQILPYYEQKEKEQTQLGLGLLKWAEEQLLQLTSSSNRELRKQVLSCVPLWPFELPEDLVHYGTITPSDLSVELATRTFSNNIFHLVHRLRSQKAGDKVIFSSSDFSRIKESIPNERKLRERDTTAFAGFLTSCSGNVASVSMEQHGSRALHSHERRIYNSSPQELLIYKLLVLLHEESQERRFLAYLTLRQIMPTFAEVPGGFKWYPEERDVLKICQGYYPGIALSNALSSESLDSEYYSPSHEFPQWISRISIWLADVLVPSHPMYGRLREILVKDSSFAEGSLPALVALVLQEDPSGTKRKELSQYFTHVLDFPQANVSCLHAIVEVVVYLRRRERSKGSPLSANTWLVLNFKLLAEKAISCGSYTSALFFLELSADHPVQDGRSVAIEKIMYEIYRNIDEPDGFYGIDDPDYERFLVRRLHHENKWEKAFQFHGATMEASIGDMSETNGVLESMHAFGFNRLALATLRNLDVGEGSLESSELFHLGWRSESWDLPLNDHHRQPGQGIYLALRARHTNRDSAAVENMVSNLMKSEMVHLRTLGSENISEIREVVQSLMCFGQIAKWSPEKLTQPEKLCKEDLSGLSGDFDFRDTEAIISTRICLLHACRDAERRNMIGDLTSSLYQALVDAEEQCLMTLSRAARTSNNKQAALNAVNRAKRLRLQVSVDVKEELSRVVWAHGEHVQAVRMMLGLLQQGSVGTLQRAEMQAQLGEWMSVARLEKANTIVQSYFEPATEMIGASVPPPKSTKETPSNPSLRSRICFKYAIFSEQQYRAILASPELERRRMYMESNSQFIKEASHNRRDTHGVLGKARQLKERDEASYIQLVAEREKHLQTAIHMHANALYFSDDFDDEAVIHLCSLWLANFESPEKDQTQKIHKYIRPVASRKFLFLSHQLTARLSSPSSDATQAENHNQTALQSLTLRMCQDHPLHSMFGVISLQEEPSGGFAAKNSSPNALDRRRAAKRIYSKVSQTSPELSQDMRDLVRASFEWATHDLSPERNRYKPGQTHNIPSNKISRIKNSKAPVMTCYIPIELSCQYNDYVKVSRFDSLFTTAGGKNLPKISNCFGSDGQKYKQLFKGASDELRQDAVVEQAFALINKMLFQDRETRKRKLSVRGYKVLPLVSYAGAGVLEFVGNTVAISAWFSDANKKYRKRGEADEAKARNEYRALCEKTPPREERVQKWQRILEGFPPIMRHYFTEKEASPMAWFAMRLNYSRSVAASSIAGHVLGVGDRHNSNILIDTRSGEVVHIDLGFAFDQGKLQKIPELIPFRMTHNTVDGMGITGTEGVFRRCAEETLRVIRDQSDFIMSVLEVFRHDPLHMWVSMDKLRKVQEQETASSTNNAGPSTSKDNAAQLALGMGIAFNIASGSAQEQADRALTSVKEKLDKTLSVEATVSHLISEATDPWNLSRLFVGWAPFQ